MISQKISVSEKLGFAAGDVSINFMLAAMGFFLPYFYTDIYGIKVTDMGILFFVARIIDAVTDPIMGLITDRLKTKVGRYRHYFLYLSIPFGFSFLLLFSTPNLDYNLKLIWVYFTYLTVTLIFTGIAIPYISYIGVLSNDPDEKLSANGYRMFFAKLGGVAFVTIFPLLLDWFEMEKNKEQAYMLAMGVFGFFATLLLLCCYFFTRERIELSTDNDISLMIKFKALLKNDQWMLLCGICIIGTLAYVLRGSIAVYYAKYYLKCDPVQVSWFLSSGIAMSIVSMVVSTWLCKFYCKLKIFRWSQLGAGVICIVMYLTISPGDILLAFGLNLLLCLIVDLHAPVFWSAIAESVDYGYKKYGVHISGLSFAAISFCQKVGAGLAGFLLGILLGYFEYDATSGDNQAPLALNGMSIMLVLIPGVCHITMSLLMQKYKITNEYYAKNIVATP